MLLDFKVLAVDKQTKARCGEIQLVNGKIPTPVFMPVGTQGTIKTLTPEYLKEPIQRLSYVMRIISV